MKVATWNVNSLKVRLPQVLDWLESQAPDALCLQETKLEDHNFPRADLESAGYLPLLLRPEDLQRGGNPRPLRRGRPRDGD